MNILEETSMLKLIYLIMLKADVDKIDVDKLKSY